MKPNFNTNFNADLLEKYAVQLKKSKNFKDGKLKHVIKTQASKLLHQTGHNLIYKNRLNEVLRSLPKLDAEQAYKMMIKVYTYFYAETMGRSRQVVCAWTKMMKPYAHKRPLNMYSLANNVLIKRFGLGNPYRVLDVHSNIKVGKPTMVVITYI